MNFTLLSFGLIFIIAGFILYQFPPKNINSLYGYRTKRSMKDIYHWSFAQKYSGRLMMWSGGVYAMLIMFLFWLKLEDLITIIIALALLILVPIILFILVEKKLKGKFNQK
ncbi:SdpI family protein [Weeksellaceae bacterium TAE3-ERU29]|nr:SdpI family protein [Weeksellaceae bacterium TAE3-ERU29]